MPLILDSFVSSDLNIRHTPDLSVYILYEYKIPFGDVGNMKSRGCRKLKRDLQVTHIPSMFVNKNVAYAVVLPKGSSCSEGHS